MINIDGLGSPSFIRALERMSEPAISMCKDKRCLTCPSLIKSYTIQSNITQKNCKVVNHTGEYLNCHSQNVVYLLTCKVCNLQYVGETAQPLHKRINGHRNGQVGCQHLLKHLKTSCNGHSFYYQILEKLPGSGYNSSGNVDEGMTAIRQRKEEYWRKTLRTIFPYGLCEKASGKTADASQITHAVGKLFPPIKRTGIRPTRSRTSRNKKESLYSTDDLFNTLDNLLANGIRNTFHRVRTMLNNTKKKVLKDIAYQIMERTDYTFHEDHE